MSYRNLLLILLPLFATTSCGTIEYSQSESSQVELAGSPTDLAVEQPIIGGTESAAETFPATGVLLALMDFPGYGRFGTMLCTGTLIAPDVVLLAAHCVDESASYGPTEYFFSLSLDVSRFGQPSMDLPAKTTAVAATVVHPDFDFDTLTGSGRPGLGRFDDIALAFLSNPITEVTPAVIATSADMDAIAAGSDVWIAGYGQRDTAQQSRLVGRKFHAPTVLNEIGDFEMQIGDVAPTPQKCHGDSGGPTFLEFDDGLEPKARIIGVTSHAYDETDCLRGGVDTRADAYRAWVDEAMFDACASGDRPACADEGHLAIPHGSLDGAAPSLFAHIDGEAGCSAVGVHPLLSCMVVLLAWVRRRPW